MPRYIDDKVVSQKTLAYENALVVIGRSVCKLFDAVQQKTYDSRSIVGDETLSMNA